MSDDEKPMSTLWYLAPFVLYILMYFGGVAWAATSYNIARDAAISTSAEPLNAAGESVAVYTNFIQTGRQIQCTSKSVSRPKPHKLTPAPFRLTNDKNDQEWILLATQLKGEREMRVRCAPTDHLPDSAQYGYAILDGYEQRLWEGQIVRWSALVASVIVFVILFRRRQRSINLEQS